MRSIASWRASWALVACSVTGSSPSRARVAVQARGGTGGSSRAHTAARRHRTRRARRLTTGAAGGGLPRRWAGGLVAHHAGVALAGVCCRRHAESQLSRGDLEGHQLCLLRRYQRLSGAGRFAARRWVRPSRDRWGAAWGHAGSTVAGAGGATFDVHEGTPRSASPAPGAAGWDHVVAVGRPRSPAARSLPGVTALPGPERAVVVLPDTPRQAGTAIQCLGRTCRRKSSSIREGA